MTRFLFTSAPLFSHLDWGGYWQTAQELVRRGHQVVWMMEEGAVAERLRQLGIEVAVVESVGFGWDVPDEPAGYAPDVWAAYRLRRNFDIWLAPAEVASATEALIDLARVHQSQAIIADPFLIAPALAGEALDLPFAIVGLPAISPVEKTWLPAEGAVFTEGLARLDQLCDRFHVSGRHVIQLSAGLWPHSPRLHLTYFSDDWYDWRGDVILPQNRFVGGARAEPPTPPPDWLADLPSDLPLVFITLGSTFNYEPEFFRIALKAVASLAAFPIVATHNQELAEALTEDTPPELALILESIDRDHLFPHLRGVIQHGGPGVTHAAILHALPQVIVAPGPGQGTQAHLVSRAGLGKFLHLEEIRLENMRNLIASVMTDPQIRANTQAYQAKFAALPGIAGAADALAGLVD